MAASKAARVVRAARGLPVDRFWAAPGPRIDAGLKASRSQYLAGTAATSNVLAGKIHGNPAVGDDGAQLCQHPRLGDGGVSRVRQELSDTVLLIDTYDLTEGARNVVRLARELGEEFAVDGVRIDSGDLATNVQEVREILDEAGLRAVKIYVSGGLDEHAIERLLEAGVRCDGIWRWHEDGHVGGCALAGRNLQIGWNTRAGNGEGV